LVTTAPAPTMARSPTVTPEQDHCAGPDAGAAADRGDRQAERMLGARKRFVRECSLGTDENVVLDPQRSPRTTSPST
jgi:hypothetical protein